MADLTPLLKPRTMAVIGASSNESSLRGRIMRVIDRHPFSGPVHPVSRREREIRGRRAYSSIREVPERVDLAIVIVPARYVPAVLEDCGRAGVRAAQIITSGFAEERGPRGVELQQRIVDIAQAYDMAVCGPNSEGFLNVAAGLAPTFSPVLDFDGPLEPAHSRIGRVGVVAQSGGVGFSFYDRGRERDLRFSYVVTTGNEACLETADVIDWMLTEGGTDVILLFLERVRDAVKFRRAAARALRKGKPLIVIKIGRSEAGARAALSHTAALVGSHTAFAAVAERYGIVEAGDTDEAIELAAAFAAWRDKRPEGRRVGILTASGGAGGWMADACSMAGLEVPLLDAATRARIDADLPSFGSSENPVDATSQAIGNVGYARLIERIAASPEVDLVAAIASTRTPIRLARDAEALARCRDTVSQPVAFWSYTYSHPDSVRHLATAGFPLFSSVRNCARALKAFRDLTERRQSFDEPRLATGPRVQGAGNSRTGSLRVLCEYEVKPLLAAQGIVTPSEVLATTPEEAVAAFERLRGPVALKLQAPALPHKTEHGLVLLGLADAEAIVEGFTTLVRRGHVAAPDAELRGVLVQPLAPDGLELILGLTVDGTFGPMVTIGLGGIFTEVLRDTVTLPLPLSSTEIRCALTRLRGWPLFAGARRRLPLDVAALEALLFGLGRFAEANAERLGELDLNPVRLHEQGRGYSIIDALLMTRMNSGNNGCVRELPRERQTVRLSAP